VIYNTVVLERYPLNGGRAECEQAERHITQYVALFLVFAKKSNSLTNMNKEDVWYELSCAVGDAIHNLRSALDHIA
jgi:hypothetical protein